MEYCNVRWVETWNSWSQWSDHQPPSCCCCSGSGFQNRHGSEAVSVIISTIKVNRFRNTRCRHTRWAQNGQSCCNWAPPPHSRQRGVSKREKPCNCKQRNPRLSDLDQRNSLCEAFSPKHCASVLILNWFMTNFRTAVWNLQSKTAQCTDNYFHYTASYQTDTENTLAYTHFEPWTSSDPDPWVPFPLLWMSLALKNSWRHVIASGSWGCESVIHWSSKNKQTKIGLVWVNSRLRWKTALWCSRGWEQAKNRDHFTAVCHWWMYFSQHPGELCHFTSSNHLNTVCLETREKWLKHDSLCSSSKCCRIWYLTYIQNWLDMYMYVLFFLFGSHW